MSSNFPQSMDGGPKTAILEDWAASRPVWQMGNVRTIACSGDGIGWLDRLERFAPEAIAASPNRLLLLARRKGVLHLPSLSHSLIMQFEIGEAWITAEEMDELWQCFQLPVFEQICGCDGSVLASECEAHDGLHIMAGQTWIVDRSARVWHHQPAPVYRQNPTRPRNTGLFGAVVLEGCACGEPGPRLKVFGSELPWTMPRVLRKVS